MARTPVRGKKIKSISELIKDAEERKEKVEHFLTIFSLYKQQIEVRLVAIKSAFLSH